MGGNVHKSEISKVTLPSTFTEEGRGLKRCGSPTLVLASLSDNSRYKNDITRIAVVCDVLTVELERENGDVIAAPGLAVDFPNQANAKGYMIDWRQLTREPSGGGTVLDAGCYKVKITFEIAGVEGSFYYSAYRLKPWTFANAKNTVQVFTVLNDVVRADEINYKDSGFAGSIRFKGSFGYMQPNYETTNLTYTDRTRKKVRIEAMRSYELRTSFVTNCYTTELDEEHLLSANQIWITEHNPLAHKQYRQFPVILSEDESPSFEYTEGVLAKVVAFFKDKVAVHESKYDGDIEAKVNASFDLPQGTQAEGCLDATYVVQYDNGTIIEQGTVPSGGSVTIDVDDPIVCQDANWQLLDSDGNVLDSGSIASGGSATINAPDGDVTVENTLGNIVDSGSVLSSGVAVFIAPDATLFLNGYLFGTIGSGRNKLINIYDTSFNQVGAISGNDYNIADGDIKINNNSTFSILAEGVQNIIPKDLEGNVLAVDSVSGDDVNLNIVKGSTAQLMTTKQTTIFRTGDDASIGYGRDFFTLQVPIDILTFKQLTGGNWTGNTNRFTDTDGAQVYGNDIVLDWSTYDVFTGNVLGYSRVLQPADIWDNQVDAGLAYSLGGFTSGWRLPNRNEINNITDAENVSDPLNYAPFNLSERSFWTSSSNDSVLKWRISFSRLQYFDKFNSFNAIFSRTFNISEL